MFPMKNSACKTLTFYVLNCFQETQKYIGIFLSFLKFEMGQVVEILPHVRPTLVDAA